MWQRFYLFFGALVLATYAVAGARGLELFTEEKQFVPAEARRGPGGYRSFHFWHSGYQGGK